MRDAQRDDAFRQLVRRLDPRGALLRTWPLVGGVSAQVTALELQRPDGETTKLIVRGHGEVDRTRNAQIARDEFRLLQIAQTHHLAAPKPIYLDESCELLPIPVLIIEYIDGETGFAPHDLAGYVTQAAAQLAKIHGVNSTPDLSFLPRQDKGIGDRPEILDTSLGEERIRNALVVRHVSFATRTNGHLHGRMRLSGEDSVAR